jgi:PAS domain S-box-containing protein
MKPPENIVPLPPLRKKVFKHSLQIVGLYIVVGALMMAAVNLASGITPRAIHLNYDSIQAAMQMQHAWNAFRNPTQHPEKTQAEWSQQFEKAIAFEEGNLTEPGEDALAKDIRALWTAARKDPRTVEGPAFARMEHDLDQLVAINEKGMFSWAARSNALSRNVFLVTIAVYFITILIALYLADGLAVRIATPLRELSEALRRKPEPGSRLKLPAPSSLEIRILSHELLELWNRVSELQKLNLEQIVAQRQQLATILASVDDGILVLDNEERVMHCSEGMRRIVGLPLEDMVGKPWRDLSTLGVNYLKLRDLLTPDVTSDRVVELEIAGRQRIFSGRCRAIHAEDAQASRQLGQLYLLHDITEIRQRDRLKTEFIGVLSHELKTPLQSLGTASELLLGKADALDAESRMLVETVAEDVGRIRGVANEFVQVGLIDLHSLRLKIEPVPLSSLIPQWIQPFQVLAKDRGVRIEFVKEGSEMIMARLDPVKFPWAITNLLSNAVRVSPAGSTVTVFLTDREKRADIEVRDEGPGIPEDVQKRMFDPFFQGGKFPGDKTSGFLGLGLTITKEVVEAHEGEIQYFRRGPKGSIFRISLPLLM